MEEVDSIIIQFLRRLNLNIDENITCLIDLPVEIIIEAASKCILAINKTTKVPTKLPSGISQRIEIAGQIAAICKDLGYKNDVGYQTFLYYNEAELRQVFMFLIERLPSEGKEDTNINIEKATKKPLFMQNIAQKINEELNSIWIPTCCNCPAQQSIGDYFLEKAPSSTTYCIDEKVIKKLIKVKSQTKKKIEDETKFKEELPAEQEKPVIHESLKELKESAITLRQKLDTLESDKNVMEFEYNQALKSCVKAEADLNNIQNILSSIGISESDIDNGSSNLLEKVQKNINLLHGKSEELTSQTLTLKVQINNIKNNNSLPETEKGKCKKVLLSLKDTAKAIKEEYLKKEELKEQLQKEHNRIKKGNKRSVYTKRIMEIISNVDKQNMELRKILEDTRQLQKDINSLEGQLERCFSIADETLFRDAKKDDQAKKAYKLLALLHSECNTIVNLVNETGCLARDIIDLEDNIKTEKAKRTEDTLAKIKLDLSRMQEETTY